MIGENIKELRVTKGLKQADVADYVGKSHNVISSWESGVNSPDVKSIEKLCALFKVSADVLLGTSCNPKPLSLAAQHIGHLYDKADDHAKQIVDLALKPFDDDMHEASDTVRVFKAAKSDDHTPPQRVDMPRSTHERLTTGKPVRSDDDI